MTLIRRAILALALTAGISPAIAQIPPPVPALPDTARITAYSINASTCACTVNFALYGDSNDYWNWVEVTLNGVLVSYNDPALGWTITSPTGQLATIPRPVTDGVLTFNNPQTGTVQIVGARRPRRVSQFSENQGVSARNLNQAITDIVAMLRENWDKTNDISGRAVLGNPGETLALLPLVANRQNMGACFDSNGNLTSCVSIPSSTFIPGNGIVFTGTGPTTIKNNIQPGKQISVTGTNPLSINYTGRTTLLASATFYVDRTNGADQAGCGLTPTTGACQSVNYLANTVLLPGYDFGGQSVFIQLANSASNYAPFIINGPWPGLTYNGKIPNVIIVGNTASPASVTIDGGGTTNCIEASGYSAFVVRGINVQNCPTGLTAAEEHTQIFFDHMMWSSMPAGSLGIFASRMGYVECIGTGNIINSVGAYFIEVSHQGNFRSSGINTGATAFTLGANIAVTNGTFVYASSLGDLTFTQYSASAFLANGHTSTGTTWSADSGGMIQINNNITGASLTPIFFPGNNPGSCLGDCFVDQAGHSGTTLTSCGTTPNIFGNDYYGTVAEGTAATGCSVVFHSAFSVPPVCTITYLGAVPSTLVIAFNTTQIGISHGSASGASFAYHCKGA